VQTFKIQWLRYLEGVHGVTVCLPSVLRQEILASGPETNGVKELPEGWFDCAEQLSLFPVHAQTLQIDSNVAPILGAHQKGDEPVVQEPFIGEALAGFVIRVENTSFLVLGCSAVPTSTLLGQVAELGDMHTVALWVGAQNRLTATGYKTDAGFSVHEAFDLAVQINASQIVIRPQDPITPSEVRSVFENRAQSQPWVNSRNLLIEPDYFYVGHPRASVVIRTLNEARYLDELLRGISEQESDNLDTEVVLVDSGSTDGTLAIAEKHGCKIVHIKREEFSFGRSLNRGCEAAQGDILVITSGHCVPASQSWLQNLCRPLIDGIAQYSYGKQFGGPHSYFSECRVFDKYFPDTSKLPQDGFYCNNANSALLKTTWQRYHFDEELTGLEDMALAQRMVRDGGKVAYVCDAPVYHYHSETWPQVRRRFEREAIALQQIMPNVHVGWFDTLRYTISSIWGDLKRAAESKKLASNFTSIIRYRYYQYTGSYRGNQQHRKLSQEEKDQYFYPH